MVLVVGGESSCRKKHTAVPVPAQPQAVPASEPPPQQPVSPAPTPAPAPQTPPSPPTTVPAKDETLYQQNKPPDQPPAPKHAARPANPAPATPPAQAPATPPPADSPHLGDILTPDQEKQYNAAIDQSLAQAQTSLASINTHPRTKEQDATVAQVLNFIQQAQKARKDDLAAAKSLAERAEVLAHDLAESLK
jgi:hypothetical protein